MSKLAGGGRRPFVGSPTQGLELIAGRVLLAGASSPTAANHIGEGFVVTRKGTGQLLITLDSAYNRIIAGDAWLWQATGGNDVAFALNASNAPDPGDVDTAGTMEVETQSVAGTAADLTGLWLNFTIWATKKPKAT